MFRHFRVSVSDRYPVKMERWRTLGTFEARNSREIQPFLVTEPQIWARYLRVEFLTQYGNEFYCPLSLLRVHGTTMLEQFRQEEEEARGLDDEGEELNHATQTDLITPAEDSGPLPPDQIPIEPIKDDQKQSAQTTSSESATQAESSKSTDDTPTHAEQRSSTMESQVSHSAAGTPSSQPAQASKSEESSDSTSISSQAHLTPSSNSESTTAGSDKRSETVSTTENSEAATQSASSASSGSVNQPQSASRDETNAASSVSNTVTSIPPSNPPVAKTSTNATASPPSQQTQPRNSPTQPNPATPSSQESFFKSIHKRLVYLEANSTLSLQYIEEQSRILRDAFIKVEKRQLAKTEKFLDHLNSTVMQELKSYRNMYDQLWQSTIIELESMKARQRAEMGEIGSRLSLMADELVWQKRMAVVQSTLLLLCLFLVLFVRSGNLGAGADIPIMQQLVGSKYSSFFETSPPRSPETGGGGSVRRRGFRNMWRSDTSGDWKSDGAAALSDAETDGRRSPDAYIPPTPDSPSARSSTLISSPVLGDSSSIVMSSRPLGKQKLLSPLSHSTSNSISSSQQQLLRLDTQSQGTNVEDEQAARLLALETQSSPATPLGTRDSKPSWAEVDRAIELLKAEAGTVTLPEVEEEESEESEEGESPVDGV